jgi:rhamnosyltransferase
MIRISVLTRTKNERNELQNLGKVLKKQSLQPCEVVVVDNNSEDDSVKVASDLGFHVVSTDAYTPGNALNIGVEKSVGDFIVLISSHCIPTNSKWLENLVAPLLLDDSIAGAYGRQLPTSDSKPNDSRDLYTIFGSESKLQKSEIFFHNANSIIRRSIWYDIPFSSTTTNIEDRIWAKDVLRAGYKIFYTPEAAVFHPHGVNHNGNESRAASVVRVIKDRELYEHERDEYWFDAK